MKFVIAVLAALATGAAWAQPSPALHLTIVDGPSAAIEGGWPACDRRDIPDAPARAIRLADGKVQLYATDQVNRLNAGPDLLHLRHDCAVIMKGAASDDPAAYDDRAWIASPWTPDGRTIWAIVHNEFHGHARPALCPTGRYMDCWYNSLTLAVSRNGGHVFERAPGRALVAAVPYRYDQVGLGHHGYFNPSNIVTWRGALYMFAFATRTRAQREGNCLLRTELIDVAGSWRAWDGSAFDVQFEDPYAGPIEPEQHVGVPVGEGRLRWPVTSLVRHARSGNFVVLMQNTGPGGGIYYSTSPDLLHWSAAALLMRAAGLHSWKPGDPDPIAYPSLLDPASADQNFETVGPDAVLFATAFNAGQNGASVSRTLIRWFVRIAPE